MTTPATHTTTQTHHRTAQLRHALTTITNDWAALLHPGGSTGRATTTGGSRPPLDTHRLDLAHYVTHLLRDWANLLVDERGLTTAPSGTDAPAMARLLHTHAPWLAAHEIGPDATHELTDAARRIHAVTTPTGARRLPLGQCPAAVNGTEPLRWTAIPHQGVTRCPGVVHATLLGDGHDEDRDLTCDTNPDHRWEPAHARRLAMLMGDDTPPRLTTPQLAEWLTQRYGTKVTDSAIRGWHHRHPLSVRPDADGTWDPVEVARWYVGWRADKARAR